MQQVEQLPQHQYQPFQSLCLQFGERYVPQSFRWLYNGLIKLWCSVFGVSEVEEIISSDFAAGRDGFWHQDWIWDQLFYPEISAALVGDVAPHDCLKRSASVIEGALQFYQKARTNSLPLEVVSGYPQDMERYNHLFSRLTIATLKRSATGRITGLRHRITDTADSDYITVGTGGHLFALPVTVQEANGQKRLLNHNELYDALVAIDQDATIQSQKKSYQLPIGPLTAWQNKDSLKLWAQVEKSNASSFQKLNSSLFHVVLERDLNPTTLDAVVSGLNSHVFSARDCRKSLQLVITNNGEFAAVINPHAGIGGTLSAKFVSELAQHCWRVESEPSSALPPPMKNSPTKTSTTESSWERLSFKNPHLDESILNKHVAGIRERLYAPSETTTFQFNGIGHATFKAKGFPVDASFHAALALAWKNHRGYVPTVGNFINLRSVKYGDIWRYDASTPEMLQFALNPTKENFLEACKGHSREIKKQKSARDEFYLGAMGLKRLVNDGKVKFSGFVLLVMIHNLFVRGFTRRFLNPDIWVSGIPSFPGLKVTGRGGSKMSYLAKNSSGGHYMIFENHIILCLMNPAGGTWLGTEKAFAAELERCLHKVANL
jgi:hypothetical protein